MFFQTAPDLYLALANGQIDGAADSMLTLAEGMKKQPGKFEIAGTFGEPFFVGWVTRPEDTSLRDAINVEIKKMRDAGQLKQWQEKWFGFAMDDPGQRLSTAGGEVGVRNGHLSWSLALSARAWLAREASASLTREWTTDDIRVSARPVVLAGAPQRRRDHSRGIGSGCRPGRCGGHGARRSARVRRLGLAAPRIASM